MAESTKKLDKSFPRMFDREHNQTDKVSHPDSKGAKMGSQAHYRNNRAKLIVDNSKTGLGQDAVKITASMLLAAHSKAGMQAIANQRDK